MKTVMDVNFSRNVNGKLAIKEPILEVLRACHFHEFPAPT